MRDHIWELTPEVEPLKGTLEDSLKPGDVAFQFGAGGFVFVKKIHPFEVGDTIIDIDGIRATDMDEEDLVDFGAATSINYRQPNVPRARAVFVSARGLPNSFTHSVLLLVF